MENDEVITSLTVDKNDNGCGVMGEYGGVEMLTDKSPRYTKWEIENRLYALIDNETIFPVDEERGPALKLMNKLLESLE